MLLMGAALWSVFCVSDHDLRAVQFELLNRFPPFASCHEQYRAWEAHRDYLDRLATQVPSLREWAQTHAATCERPLRFWSLLLDLQLSHTGTTWRLTKLQEFQSEFPEAWRTGWFPRLLPWPLLHAPLPDPEPD